MPAGLSTTTIASSSNTTLSGISWGVAAASRGGGNSTSIRAPAIGRVAALTGRPLTVTFPESIRPAIAARDKAGCRAAVSLSSRSPARWSGTMYIAVPPEVGTLLGLRFPEDAAHYNPPFGAWLVRGGRIAHYLDST